MIPTPNGLDIFVLFATAAIVMLIYTRNKNRSALPYPPGPKKLPILDSDIIHLRAAGNDFIVLNSFEAAIDLLEQRSSIYSSRPQFTMVKELMGWEWAFSGMPYGEAWRERRRAFTKYFQTSKAILYRAPQVEFIRKTLPRLLDTPDDFLSITQHAIGGTVLSLAYGLPILNSNDPLVTLAEKALDTVTKAAIPGAFLVDIIPILKYVPEFVPGAGFKKKARIWRKLQEDMHELPYKETLKNMASGVAKPSFTSTGLQDLDESNDVSHQREVIQDTAGMIFTAGADTITSSVHTFFAAMLCFPETQRKAQQELDLVLEGRLPDFGDEPDLPYISAIAKEIMRWKPATPIGVPHCSTEDDVYGGYHIPKGALVIANAWAMLYDENVYPDPSAFKPERFLKDGKLDPAVRDPALMAFGFGRRICPGSHVAISALWLTVATILATFNISNAVDDNGAPIAPSVQYKSALICHPLPFACTLKSRSKAAEKLIQQETLLDV